MKQLLLIALAAASVVTGCQTVPYQGEARDVKRRPQEGGVVAIARKFRPEDRTRADESMRTNCSPLTFKIVEEGEVVTGQEVTANTRETNRANSEQQVGSLWGIPITSGDKGGKDAQTSSVTKDLKEWQISYACIAAEKPAPTTTRKVSR
jgi:hypothetical protein